MERERKRERDAGQGQEVKSLHQHEEITPLISEPACSQLVSKAVPRIYCSPLDMTALSRLRIKGINSAIFFFTGIY